MIKCQNVVEVKKGRELAVVQRKRENKAKSKMKYTYLLLIMENATPRNSEYILMKLGTVIRC
jgi:hypothetical protein